MDKFNYKLTFKNDIVDSILCLDAVLPGIEFFSRFNDVPLLAADGASLKLYDLSIIPGFIIGDLDTFSSNPLSEQLIGKSEIIHSSEQETNDFEKSLNFCIGKGWKNIMIAGFHGGALEHTLNNWSIIKKFSRRLNLCIYDDGRYALPVYNSISFNPEMNELISIIPQPMSKMTTKGLQWELKNETLELGLREGARNIARAEVIDIELHIGEYLLFIDQRLPQFPIFDKLK
ncbi:MAG: thiamine diphosphokinase [Ignavibacteriae bacterium]|nr:thiamine diphosphokinase [Ignavibacteriota bacterium]